MIVALSGGIGNQLFQYAFGRGYEQRTGEKVVYDTLMLNRDPNREYELGQYCLTLSRTKGLRPVFCYVYDKLVYKNKFLSGCNRVFKVQREEELFVYQDNFVRNSYVIGYWQNEKYFANVAEEIKKEIVYTKMLNIEQKKLVHKIENENAVAIHIRRGDYLSQQFNDIYYCLDKEYYLNAINFIKQKVDTPKFYMFSDDIEWCKREYSDMDNITYIDNSVSQSQHVDLHIMRQCKYFIIANSTFSWWGAWLSQYKKKIIVAPNNWFKDTNLNCAVKEAILINTVLI